MAAGIPDHLMGKLGETTAILSEFEENKKKYYENRKLLNQEVVEESCS